MLQPKTIKTVWEYRTYDVWGNAQDGYEVNNVFRSGTVTLRLKVHTHNAGTPQEFRSAYPSNLQLARMFGRGIHDDNRGDDMTVYLERERDGYPAGELRLISHDSLSPIGRKIKRSAH